MGIFSLRRKNTTSLLGRGLVFPSEKNIVACKLSIWFVLFLPAFSDCYYFWRFPPVQTHFFSVLTLGFRVIVLSKLFKTHCQDRLHKPICLNFLPLHLMHCKRSYILPVPKKTSWVIHQFCHCLLYVL